MALSFQNKIKPIEKTLSFQDRVVSVKETKPEYQTYEEPREEKIARFQEEAKQAEAFAKKEKSFGGLIKNTITAEEMGNLPFVGGAIKTAKTINKIITAPGKQEQAFAQQLSDRELQLVKTINQKKKEGLDVSKDVREYNSVKRQLAEYMNALDKSNTGLPSSRQALAEVAQTGLDVVSSGAFGKGFKSGQLEKARPSVLPEKNQKLFSKETLKQIGINTPIGLGYGLTQGIEEGKTGKELISPTIVGGAVAAAIPTAFGAAGSIAARKTARKSVDKLIATITQGKDVEIPQFKRALTQLTKDELKDVKTFKDFKSIINEKIAGISEGLDSTLKTNPTTKKLENLEYKTKIGGIDVTHNYVDDAFSQLEDFYQKTNNTEEFIKIQQLKNKAQTQGLSIMELENLAKQHGRDLSGFNANGQAASGLSRQAAENTRKGLKGTARQLFGDKIYEQVDSARSDLISLRDSAENMIEEVNKLQRRIVERGLGEKVGRLVFRVFDVITGGTMRGFIQAGFPRSQGIKIMNALEIEKRLQKNLIELKKLIPDNVPEKQIIKNLEDFLKKNQSRELLNKNPIIQTANKNSSIDISPTIQQAENISTKPKEKGFLEAAKENLKNRGQAGFAQLVKPYKESGASTTKILKKLEGRTTVSKQFIEDLTNAGDIKQVERDLIREMLKGEGATINVADFANKVRAELLPIKRNTYATGGSMGMRGSAKYEGITLPYEVRGNVKNYSEFVYESPISTSAGNAHFPESKNYFGHTRIEDMADGKTRRVIEVQSDLYQKGNLDREMPSGYGYSAPEITRALSPEDAQKYQEALRINRESNVVLSSTRFTEAEKQPIREAREMIDKLESKAVKVINEKRANELKPLQQYNDPTAHFRMIREEIKKAAQDGKTKLQFPTGETAMKIEQIGDNSIWLIKKTPDAPFANIKADPNNLSIGMEITRADRPGLAHPTLRSGDEHWIITEVLGDGKFKAIPKNKTYLPSETTLPESMQTKLPDGKVYNAQNEFIEQFDISGKVDTNNPIYRFYEKDLGKYLTSKYNAKLVTDNNGVKWYQVDITPEMKGAVEAFGKARLGVVSQIGLGTMAVAGGLQLKKKLENKDK